MNRREFLQFLSASGVAVSLLNLESCSTLPPALSGLKPSSADELATLNGLDYKILIRWGDQINQNQKFGFNNDFIAFHSLGENHGILWVNHEYITPLFIAGEERTKANVDKERLEVGGSLIEVKKINGDWKLVEGSQYNRRLDATTEIPFAWPQPIKGSKKAIGTMGNCAGGYTPWQTVLTCEENYDMFWGERDRKSGKVGDSWLKWQKFYPLPPEHYGWVVEVDPLSGKSKKLVSLGRCAHECAAVTKAKNGKIVAYTGDDSNNEHLYKLISHSENSLEEGTLYVANLEQGKWISLSIDEQPLLKKHFKDQTEVLTYLREAAKLMGATPLDRPEDIEFDPLTGHVFIALTNNKPKNNFHGSILKIREDNDDPGSLTFRHDVFLAGGAENGFSSPDNMVFDPQGNLWFTSDMGGNDMGSKTYQQFGNNSLFVFIRKGRYQGQIIRVANAPNDAELTGPCFSPDYKTLFLSVQHPGETSPTLQALTSHWPDGGIPKPAVVTLQGELLNKIVSGNL